MICPLAKTRFVHFGPDIDQYEVVCIECNAAARSLVMCYYYILYIILVYQTRASAGVYVRAARASWICRRVPLTLLSYKYIPYKYYYTTVTLSDDTHCAKKQSARARARFREMIIATRIYFTLRNPLAVHNTCRGVEFDAELSESNIYDTWIIKYIRVHSLKFWTPTLVFFTGAQWFFQEKIINNYCRNRRTRSRYLRKSFCVWSVVDLGMKAWAEF